MALGFLELGDGPLYSTPAYAWPRYGRVGDIISGTTPAVIAESGNKASAGPRALKRVEARRSLMRDDNDLVDIIVFMLENNILD